MNQIIGLLHWITRYLGQAAVGNLFYIKPAFICLYCYSIILRMCCCITHCLCHMQLNKISNNSVKNILSSRCSKYNTSSIYVFTYYIVYQLMLLFIYSNIIYYLVSIVSSLYIYIGSIIKTTHKQLNYALLSVQLYSPLTIKPEQVAI